MTEPGSTTDDRTPFWSRNRLLTAGLTAALLIVALFILLDRGEPYVELMGAGQHPNHSDTLVVSVSYCGGTYASGAVETDTEVSVWIYPITPIRGGPQPACADGVQIQLREPLGNRSVIDGRTGRPIRLPE